MSEKNRRRTIARHGQLRSPRAWSQLMKFIGMALAVVLVSGVSVAAFVVADFSSTVASHAVDLDDQKMLPPNIGEYKGGFDLLMVGVDTCEEQYKEFFGDRCKGPESEGTLNDVNLLVHVSEEPRRITAVSFPRDLMLPIPECEDENGRVRSAMGKMPLNVAYSDGGLNCVAKTITLLTGQDIEFAAAVTFGGVIEITNAIGGVDVCLATPIRDYHTRLDLAEGTHTLEGLPALQFLRTRHGVGDGSDLGRIGNQQQYMSSLARKLISGEVLGNIPVMMKLANAGLSNLTPSTSLADPMKIVQIALAVKNVSFEDIVFVQYPTFSDPNDANKVVPDKASAAMLWEAVTANQQLLITHENNAEYDGVVIDDTAAGEAVISEGAIELPSSIRGNSAATVTCSNGKQR